MEWEITWDGDPEDVLVSFAGRVTLDELDYWVQEVVADSRYREGLRVIVDHRLSEWEAMTAADIRRRAEQISDADGSRVDPPHRIAWVAGRRVDYGLGRMMQAYSDGRQSYAFQVFDDIDKAREWLREQHDDVSN